MLATVKKEEDSQQQDDGCNQGNHEKNIKKPEVSDMRHNIGELRYIWPFLQHLIIIRNIRY